MRPSRGGASKPATRSREGLKRTAMLLSMLLSTGHQRTPSSHEGVGYSREGYEVEYKTWTHFCCCSTRSSLAAGGVLDGKATEQQSNVFVL